MTDAGDETRITLRLPAPLRDRLTTSAADNARSMNGEIVARLDDSFEHDLEGYRELAELFVETMKENADQGRRELEEYRQFVGTIKLMRHTIDRLVEEYSGDIPSDIELLLTFLSPRATTDSPDVLKLLEELHVAQERHDAIEREMVTDTKERRDRVRDLMARLDARLSGQRGTTR